MKHVRPGSVDQNAVQDYLRAIKGEALLTSAEECSLAEAIARGDRDARTRMIRANLRLVVKIAQEYLGRGLVLEDLIGEGNIGLIHAAELFEPRFGTRFCTYASFWIKQSIVQGLSNSIAMIRLPLHMVGLLNKWRKAERVLGLELDRTPSFNEVASSLGLSETQKMLLSRAQHARQLKLESSTAREEGRWSPVQTCDPYGPPDLAVESLEDQHLLRLPHGLPGWARADHSHTALWSGKRNADDAQGNCEPIRCNPGMGAGDRAQSVPQAQG